MKIFNLEPINVTGYVFNEQHLAKSHTNYSYESGFSFTGEVIQSLNTLIVTFDILYTIDEDVVDLILPSYTPDKFTIHIEGEIGSGDIFLSYNSSCQFNFESEGFDADLLSITEFLAEYCAHTKAFFNQYGFKPILKKEEEMRMLQTIRADALVAIDNLRGNNMYEF